jgi:hypothetical protein
LSPSEELLEKKKKLLNANLTSLTERYRKVFDQVNVSQSSIEVLEKTLNEATFKNFIDPEFPPNDSSLGTAAS